MRQLKRGLAALILLLVAQRAVGSTCVTNSSGEQACAAIIFKPSTLEDLRNAVKEALLEGKKVRAIGGLHSAISDVTVGPHNYLIDTAGLDRILEIDIQNQTIKAQAGVNLHTLSQVIAKLGWQLIDQPGAYDITVAGMVANGAHGSGMHGCISDKVVAVELVDGYGNLRTISACSNSDWLPAARLSLGVLGVIYSVTFKCCSTKNRNVFAEITSADASFFNHIPTHLENNQNFQFLVNPYSKRVLKQTFNEVCEPCTDNTLRNFKRYLEQSEIMGELSNILNPITPPFEYDAINDALVNSGATNVREFFYKGYSFFHDNTASRARIVEIAVNADQIVPALKKLFKIVDNYRVGGSKFITMAEVRYVHDCEFTLLSPTRSDHPSWLIGLILVYPFDTTEATNLLSDLTDALMQSPFDGRPSWGNNPEFLTFHETKQLYGADNVAAFNAIRRELDPHGLFYTPYFQQRLGPQ